MLFRGIYYDAWRPSANPEKIRTREEFLARIGANLVNALIEPEEAARGLSGARKAQCSARSSPLDRRTAARGSRAGVRYTSRCGALVAGVDVGLERSQLV